MAVAERRRRTPARRRVVRGLAPSACGPGPLVASPGLSPKDTRDSEQYHHPIKFGNAIQTSPYVEGNLFGVEQSSLANGQSGWSAFSSS